mmetsp:Transcript_1221/g.1621  ORF Transcript_1221/g.1621 Transcript_1221/m.1621 type:complete len:235 (-) Transcript_1221:13-717(-)
MDQGSNYDPFSSSGCSLSSSSSSSSSSSTASNSSAVSLNMPATTAPPSVLTSPSLQPLAIQRSAMSSFASFSPVSSFASSSPSSGSKRPSGKQEKEQPVRRGNKDRLVVKLSVDLLQTFNLINQSYYLQKKKRLSEQRRNPAHKKQRRHGGNVDKECNYIVKYAEVLNERYIVEKIIGKGSFGRVVRAHDKVTQEQVAIKIIKRKDPFFNQAQVEIKILQTLQEQENAHIGVCY